MSKCERDVKRPNSPLRTSALSATTSLLELASLRDDVGLLVCVRAETEMLVCLSGVFWSSEENGVGTLWRTQSELIESQALATGSFNSLSSSAGESECGNRQLLLEVDQTNIIGDGADEDDGVLGWVGLAVCDLTSDA